MWPSSGCRAKRRHSALAAQHRAKVMLHRLSDCAHLQGVGELVAGEPEAPAKRGHLFGGRCQTDLRRGHLELDRGAVGRVGADFDFSDAARVRQHELDLTGSRYAKITRLGMQRRPVGCGFGLLSVDQKWFAHMRKRDFFEVVEWFDRGVFTGSAPLPYPE